METVWEKAFAVLYGTGAPGTIRTCDLCLRRAALYPAELRALWRDCAAPIYRMGRFPATAMAESIVFPRLLLVQNWLSCLLTCLDWMRLQGERK